MRLSRDKTDQFLAGIWLIGLGILIYTASFWPGILFLAGTVVVVQGLARGRGIRAFQAGFWMFALGVWALFRFHFAVLIVVAGLGMVFTALSRPTFLGKKPRPRYHDWLE